MLVRRVIVLNWMRRGRAHLFEGRLPFCSAVIGLEVLVPAMGYLPMVVADGGRIHRTMTSLPYMECIIKVLLRVALFGSEDFRARVSPLPPKSNVGTLGPPKKHTTQPEYPNFGFRG